MGTPWPACSGLSPQGCSGMVPGALGQVWALLSSALTLMGSHCSAQHSACSQGGFSPLEMHTSSGSALETKG